MIDERVRRAVRFWFVTVPLLIGWLVIAAVHDLACWTELVRR